MMRCKVGDLAVVLRDEIATAVDMPNFRCTVHFGGWVVRCESLTLFQDEPCWVISECPLAEITTDDGRTGAASVVSIPDRILRPIRDQPGADETLTRKSVPSTLPTKEPA